MNMAAMVSMQRVHLGNSSFAGKQLQMKPATVSQPFKPVHMPVQAAKTFQGKVVSTSMQKTAVRLSNSQGAFNFAAFAFR